MKFLIDRFRGEPFKECSGWSKIQKSKKNAREFRKKLKTFGWI